MLIVLLLLGCQEPFGTDRHDLEGFRVAAVRVDVAAGPVGTWLRAESAVVVDGRPWSVEPVDMRWYWLEGALEVADLAPDRAVPAGFGPAPLLRIPEGGRGPLHLGLIASAPDGAEERVVLSLRRSEELRAAPILSVIEARPAAVVGSGDELTLEATFEDPEGPPMLRWMSVGGRGTFTEQDATTTTWTAAELELEDGELIDSAPLGEGAVTVLGLAVDGSGGNDFGARELWVGEPGMGLWTPSGRWVGTDIDPGGARWVRGVLVADDTAPTGLVLEQSALVAPTDLSAVDPYGTELLSCQLPVSGPFDPDWLLQGRCLRPQVEGATVVLQVAQ